MRGEEIGSIPFGALCLWLDKSCRVQCTRLFFVDPVVRVITVVVSVRREGEAG